MLVTGTAVSILLILTAIFAPLIAPYSFDTYQDAAGRFPQQGAPSARNHWGTTVQGFDVMSRTIYGARTAVEVVILAVVFSIAIGVPLGPDLGLHRRLAGPHPRPDHGRAVRVPVPAAGDRRGVPAQEHDRLAASW